MTTAAELVAGGFSSGQAKAVGGQFADVVAAGTTISDATALTASNSNVTTVTAGQGVKLANTEIGDEYEVYNAASVQLLIYPPTASATINQLSGGVAAVLAPKTAAKFKKRTATAWTGSVSA